MKTIKSFIDKINKTNAAYEKKTPAQKRVQIAKDVLLALNSRAIKATHMSYFYDNSGTTQKVRWSSPNKSLKDLLPELPACNVCAKGAIFVCAVARQNNVTVDESQSVFSGSRIDGDWVNGDKTLSVALGDVFEADQLKIIEDAFEDMTGAYSHFYNKYGTPRQRMEALMRNIIRNRGRLVLTAK